MENELEKIRSDAPIIIHQRMCFELVDIAKKTDGKELSKHKKFNSLLNAIDVLEELYPELRN